MSTTVSFRHTEPVETLRAYAEEKMSKLKKYLDSPFDAHVVLGVEKFRHSADVTLSANGTRIKAVEETGDMYSAIDQVMDKIEKQLKRHLEKTKERRLENARGEEALLADEETSEPALGQDEPVIEVERIVAKPMDPEEAAMQLSISSNDFLVFRNAGSDEINVIYTRKDGKMVLITPSS